MNKINNQYYSSNLKAEHPKRTVANAPDNLPSYSLCRDENLNKKMSALNKDIYKDSKKTKNKKETNFLKWFSGLIVLVLGIKLFRNKF